MAAAEQKRMNRKFAAKTGKDLAAMMKKHKLSRPGPSLTFEQAVNPAQAVHTPSGRIVGWMAKA